MKTMMTCALTALAALNLTAMPTREETERAEPLVKKLLTTERAALESGKMTRSEVAGAALKFAELADAEAAKLLLMKGAFVLYVKDGNLDKAAETMNALETAISDLPPQIVSNMVELALLGVNKKEDGARLHQLLAAMKPQAATVKPLGKDRTTVQSIIDGMIKVPGRDYWLSETELTQGQWEAVMGYNLSAHKGVNLPVECVSRDDCDVFLEKLNQAREVRSSQFEFRLPELEEWKYAAWAGSTGRGTWIKPGVVGEVCDMAWVRGNSSNQTHAVATKAPNAFGFYDMMGNVWEWLLGDAPGGRGHVKGCHFRQKDDCCNWNANVYLPKTHRNEEVGLRVAAHIRTNKVASLLPRLHNIARRSGKNDSKQRQATIDGYTWSYRVKNGDAEIMSEKDGKRSCAVSPNPKGHLAIPSTIEGVKVTSIGEHAFFGCGELNSVTIPVGVKNIRNGAFYYCSGLTSISISSSVTDIVPTAFVALHSVKLFSVASDNLSYSSRNGLLCSKDGSVLVAGVNGDVTIPAGVKTIGRQSFLGRGLNMTVTIPTSVTKIEERAFAYCLGLTSVTMCGERPEAPDDVFSNCGKLKEIHVPANAKSWAGMKEWQGKTLVFDEKKETAK